MEKEIESLLFILKKGNPIIFLGAGFSLGASKEGNVKIPTGKELKEELIKQFTPFKPGSNEYKELLTNSLSNVCSYISQEFSEAHLNNYLTDRFSGYRPAEFHLKLKSYPWQKIYTTNIDTLCEEIYSYKNLLIQNAPQKNSILKSNRVELIKLHGDVNNKSQGFTFSHNEYINSMIESRDYRFSSLGHDMQVESFVFLGSDFSDFNIDYYLKLYEAAGSGSTRGKLFFINPYPSIIFESRIKSLGGVLIKKKTDEFLKLLEHLDFSDDTPIYDKNLERSGFKSISHIKQSLNGENLKNSNLYFGAVPSWEDIFGDWDFRNPKLEKEAEEKIDFFEKSDESTLLFSLIGKPFSGKSTYLKRLAQIFQQNGYACFYHEGRQFNYYELIKKINHESDQKYALILDNASYHYGTLKHFLKNAKSKKLIVITASRPFFHFRKRYQLLDQNFHEFILSDSLSNENAKILHDTLSEKGFLGELKKHNDIDDRISWILRKKNIIDVLFSITHGYDFVKRIKKDINNILKEKIDSKGILVKISIFSQIDIPYYPKEILVSLYKSGYQQKIERVKDYIRENENGDFEIRNTLYQKSILKSCTNNEIITAIKETLIHIAPLVDELQHSYWNEIMSALVKEKLLRKQLGLKTKEIKEMLTDLRGYYSNNYNYWLQLGVAEQMELDFEKALNHFKQAESLNSNSYMVKNAIGRNYLKYAVHLENNQSADFYFKEGEKILLSLIQNDEEYQVRAFSTHCYLYEKINFLKKTGRIPGSSELKKMFDLLDYIIKRDPDDFMAKHISNYFFNYLKSIKKSHVIRMDMYDVSRLKSLFSSYKIDLDSILDDYEID